MSYEDFQKQVYESYGYDSWDELTQMVRFSPNPNLPHKEAAELYAQSKVSEALKLAESLAEKEKRELWDRACEAQRNLCANQVYDHSIILFESVVTAPKPEYKP